jgi:hypothetical protein
MKIIKGKRMGKTIEIKEIPMSSMMLLPPRSDVCQECAVDHDPQLPHNPRSIYYQTKFKMEHRRGATWADAMEHCSDEMKELWIEELRKVGIMIPNKFEGEKRI